MSLKAIKLGGAHRQFIYTRLLPRAGGSAESAQKGSYIRRKLELDSLGRRIEKLSEKLRDFGLGIITWDCLMRPDEFAEDVADFVDGKVDSFIAAKLSAIQRIASTLEMPPESHAALENLLRTQHFDDEDRDKIGRLVEQVKVVTEEREFTLDSAYLSCLHELAKGADLSKEKVMDRQTGQVRETEQILMPAMMDTFAEVIERLEQAMASPDLKEA